MLDRMTNDVATAVEELAPQRAPRARKQIPIAPPKLQNKHQQRIYSRGLMIVADILAISVAFALASWFRFGGEFYPQTTSHLGVILPVYLLMATNFQAYSIKCVESPRHGISNALIALVLSLSVASMIVFFLKSGTSFSRVTIGTGTLLSVVSIPLLRTLVSKLTRRLFGAASLNELLIIDGIEIEARPGVLVLDAELYDLRPRLDDPVMFDRLGGLLLNADRVVVACPAERRWLWAQVLKGADVKAEVFAPELEALGPIGIGRFGALHTLVVATGPLAFNDRVRKRLFDLLVTIVSLPVVLPIMLVTAIAIRIDSPGPIFFVQERVGRGNRLFPMYKFRSMRVEQLDRGGNRSTGRADNRVTRVGRFIRKTSIDELPQFLNVLFGQMSIVGPRPHALGSRAEEKLFWDIDANYWHRHAVKPGLTGLAQVRGYRGATEKVADLNNRLQADLEYLSGWSIWRDVSIMMATFRVLMHRNAF